MVSEKTADQRGILQHRNTFGWFVLSLFNRSGKYDGLPVSDNDLCLQGLTARDRHASHICDVSAARVFLDCLPNVHLELPLQCDPRRDIQRDAQKLIYGMIGLRSVRGRWILTSPRAIS